MFDCPICVESKEDYLRVDVPCCRAGVCSDCVQSDGRDTVVRYQGDRYVCVFCQAEVLEPNDYAAILNATDVGVMQAARAALVPVATTLTTVDGPTLRSNAWMFGAYTHSPGCGSAVSIVDGCDTLNCTTCGVQINIAGGQPGQHTYEVEGFFAAVGRFTTQTDAGQLDKLEGEFPNVWAARYMPELVAGVRDGSLVGWIDSMADYVWGSFPQFLRARVAPQAAGGPDGASLFALIASIEGTPDAAVLTAHYHSVEATPGTELAVGTARHGTVGRLTDDRVKEIARGKLRNTTWWRR